MSQGWRMVLMCWLLALAAAASWNLCVYMTISAATDRNPFNPSYYVAFLLPAGLSLSALLGVAVFRYLFLPVVPGQALPARADAKDASIVAMAFLIGAFVCTYLVIDEHQQEVRLKQLGAETVASAFIDKVEGQLLKAELAATALGTWVQGGGNSRSEFDLMAQDLLLDAAAISALLLAHQGMAQQIYPQEVAADVVGIELTRTLQDQWRGSESNTPPLPQVSGLVTLNNGAQGLYVSYPIYLNRADSRLWGFAVAVLDLRQLLELASFKKLADDYFWTLYRGDDRLLATADKPINLVFGSELIHYASGHWRLELLPREGWIPRGHFKADAILVTLLLSAFVTLSFLMRRHSRQLRLDVTVKTEEIRQANSEIGALNSLLEQSQRLAETGSWRYDLRAEKLQWSVETYRIFNVTGECGDLLRLFRDAVHEEDRQKVDEAWSRGLATGRYEVEHRIWVQGATRWVKETAEFQHDDRGLAVVAVGAIQDVTQLKQYQLRLEQSEQQLKLSLEAANLGIWDYDISTQHVRYDEGWARMLGLSLVQIEDRFETWSERVHPRDLNGAMEALEAHLNGKSSSYEAEFRMRNTCGEWQWIQAKGRVVKRDSRGNPLRIIGVHIDIAERKKRELELKALYAALDKSPMATVVTTPEPRIIYANPAFTRLSGYSMADVVGLNPRVLQSGRTPKATYTSLWETISSGAVWDGEFWNRRKSGEICLERVTVAPVIDGAGDIVNYVATKEDITQRKENELRVWKQANFDPLTGLANRISFMQRLNDAILRAQRNRHQLAVLFVDLDLFKPVNDSYGHDAGDLLLQMFAERLLGLLRESDIVGRIGGDEFGVVMEQREAPVDREFIRQKLELPLSQPYSISTERGVVDVVVGASIGVAEYPKDGNSAEVLLSQSDARMYAVKLNHHGR